MKNFHDLKTARLHCGFRELSVRQSRELCAIRAGAVEATITTMLRSVMIPRDGATVSDPLAMTVQERVRAVSHYMGSVLDDGPNFAVGDKRLSDFLDISSDIERDEVIVGDAHGIPIICSQLLGVHAEELEKVCKSWSDWVIGMMACQIRLADEPRADLLSMANIQRAEWLDKRMCMILEMPESQAIELHQDHLLYGQEQLQHFFCLSADENGLAYLSDDEGGLRGLGRFRPISTISKRKTAVFCRSA